jgi:putative DNA methylase
MTQHRRTLIEVALPLPEINDASAYDKMPGIGPHPKGIHQWWARLPLPTARAVLFASVVTDPADDPAWQDRPVEEQDLERERLFGIIRRMMGKKLHEHPEVYAEANAEMRKHCGGKLPTVFDPFAGGGSIPLEANRLGFQAEAADLNPVAVLLNKCNLEIAPRWAGHAPVNPKARKGIGGTSGTWRGTQGLAADVRYYGEVIRQRAIEKIGHLYPKVTLPKEHGGGEANVITWIWARTVASPNPAARGKHVPLISTFMLSTKKGRLAWIEPVLDEAAPSGWRVVVGSGDISREKAASLKRGTKAGKGQDFLCLLTGAPIPRTYVQEEGKAGRLSSRLVAVVAEAKRGKLYVTPDEIQEGASRVTDPCLIEAKETFLAGELPTRAEITGGVCTAYGLATWGHLFTPRQLLALIVFSDLAKQIHADVQRDAKSVDLELCDAHAYARAIVTFLALAVDRCADFNCSLSTWKPSGEQQMHLFTRQALPMTWDYTEANLMGEKAICWQNAVGICADALTTIAPSTSPIGKAKQSDAASDGHYSSGILVSTDPPYYDNISYATLSDFFYAWLRRSLGEFYPDIFSTVLVPKMPELIASPDRFGGSRTKAREHFESGFRTTFTILRERLDRRFPLTVYYAFKQSDQKAADADSDDRVDLTTGWETLLDAIVSSGFQITATWPVRASQQWRMVSMGSNALASYIVLACRPRSAAAPHIGRREFMAHLKRELPEALRHLQQGNIAPVDLAQASIGPGMAVFSRYARVVESSGDSMSIRTALGMINQMLDEVLTEQEGDFDPDTRWAIAWFDQNGFAEGEFGVAETLSKAKNTSVAGMVEAGILSSKSGDVRLLRPDELPGDWDPATDKRLTAWEAVHHLVRVLEAGGESAAAELVAKLGSGAETARELAYRLFTLCERRKRPTEALSYNALVQSWPEIVRLAREQAAATTGPTQGVLF